MKKNKNLDNKVSNTSTPIQRKKQNTQPSPQKNKPNMLGLWIIIAIVILVLLFILRQYLPIIFVMFIPLLIIFLIFTPYIVAGIILKSGYTKKNQLLIYLSIPISIISFVVIVLLFFGSIGIIFDHAWGPVILGNLAIIGVVTTLLSIIISIAIRVSKKKEHNEFSDKQEPLSASEKVIIAICLIIGLISTTVTPIINFVHSYQWEINTKYSQIPETTAEDIDSFHAFRCKRYHNCSSDDAYTYSEYSIDDMNFLSKLVLTSAPVNTSPTKDSEGMELICWIKVETKDGRRIGFEYYYDADVFKVDHTKYGGYLVEFFVKSSQLADFCKNQNY